MERPLKAGLGNGYRRYKSASDEELGPAPKKPVALDVNQLMDEELGMRMAMPQERPTKPQVSRPAPTSMPSEDSTPAPSQEAYRGIGQALKDTAISSMDLAVAMLPGAGSMEAGGAGVENPVSAALNLEELVLSPLWQRTWKQNATWMRLSRVLA